MSARPSRRCHTSERKTGLEARNHGVSGADPVIGPELPERVEQVRAALPDADRARFEQDLDQALDMARSTRALRPLGPRRRGLAAGGVRSSARRPAVGGDRGAASAGC
jgi:Family of unknown function (DUF6247)